MNESLMRLRIEMFAAGQLTERIDPGEFQSLLSDLADCFLPESAGPNSSLRHDVERLEKDLATAKASVAQLEQRQYALSTDSPDVQYSAALVVGAETGAIIKSRYGKPPATPIEEMIAKSSLGTIPITEHTKLLKATGELVQVADLVLDGLTRQQRHQLQRAIAAVAEAIGG